MSAVNETPFLRFLRLGVERGGFETDDVLASALPLFRQALAAHECGRVAPLIGLTHVTVDGEGQLGFAANAAERPRRNESRVHELQKVFAARGLTVIGQARRETDLDEMSESITDLAVGAADAELTRPVFLPGYTTWEHAVGHHDELADLFSLGQLLASLALGLDFTEPEDVEAFATHRGNLFALQPRLNPVLATVIRELTELDRHRRAQDLLSIIRRLETWREQAEDVDYRRLNGFAESGVVGRRRLIQQHLRDRLFEISRRNRLLHFKPSQATLNLTVGSVPLVLDWRNIRAEQLFYWHPALAAEIAEGKPLSLGRWLRFEDAPYLPGALDQLSSTARRDRAEYGFAQLRLVLVFLRWHNLKETPQERIHSPLLLLPVELTKKRGVRDQYVLDPTTHEAEVNPALRHHLKQLYGLDLPATVDLRATPLAEFHADLMARIRASEPGVMLELVDKPRIQLIHERARQRADQFRRKQRLHVRPVRTDLAKVATDYSYDREDFSPRGLKLFLERIQPTPAPLREVAGEKPLPRPQQFAAETAAAPPAAEPVREVERQAFALRESELDATGNPYSWEFDLTALTLGNFNYRKMTLVRDYTNLLETDVASTAFDRVFSLDPRAPEEPALPTLPPGEQHLVVPADATQVGAIARARAGRSYIIQGPPGTGKSQTITNLIADYVARGQRVLFVCEKRAAIDVVFHRLRQQGLDELCCLIHDSQTDKKSFVQNLKQTCEAWLAATVETNDPETARTKTLRTLESELAALSRFSEAMTAVPAEAGVPLHSLVMRLVELRGSPKLTSEHAELLPGYTVWLRHGGTVQRLARALAEVGADECFARHPFRWLVAAVVQNGTPLATLRDRLDRAETLLDSLSEALEQAGFPADERPSITDLAAVLAHAQRLEALTGRGQLALLDAQGELALRLRKLSTELTTKEAAANTASAKTTHWREPLTAADTATALGQAQQFAFSTFAWLSPAWWRLRGVLKQRYDFSAHAVRPLWTQILGDLAAAQAATAALAETQQQATAEFGTADLAGLSAEVTGLRAAEAVAPPAVRGLHGRLLSSEGPELVAQLLQLLAGHRELCGVLDELLVEPGQLTVSTLAETLREIREESEQLPELLPVLGELAELPVELARALRQVAIPSADFEAALARTTLDRVFRGDRALERFDGAVLARRVERLDRGHRELLAQNAAAIRAGVRRRFREHVDLAAMSATQLNAGQKLFKKRYASGRRDLEHEFGKTMRFKAIRELAAGDTGDVVRDLKPVWLMSPLSVSDTLPLDPDLFDVVIFDEASQIPVEEAVPALYRAPQVIVVGDEMQLPPTNFFSAKSDDGDGEAVAEEDGERVALALDADSFLTQSAQNLPATLLAWHYRSRYEALISFSNSAFYGGELFTIPDRQLAPPHQPELHVSSPADAETHAAAVLARSVSFHFCPESVYADRRNAVEAGYIARLVRTLLSGGTKLSLGIVAFSEAQQTEIEQALDALAEEDGEFGGRLEEERNREENDQFCGLFVKNLENVQGDERDIILLSICYGPDTQRQVRMNFGPINQRGGEKRLNVIFSRARHHMAVISSLRHGDITNDWNDGAAALKQFLHYAEAVSIGDHITARRVLEGLNPLRRKSLAPAAENSAVTEQIAAALRERGWEVALSAGQSKFRCDLAVRPRGDAFHQLAVFVDAAAHYANSDVAERHVTRPGILRAFGWRVAQVLTKDWLADPETVLRRLERQLEGLAEEPATDPDVADMNPQPTAHGKPCAEGGVQPAEPVSLEAGATGSMSPAGEALASCWRRFEFAEGKAAKFWEIAVNGMEFTVCYGRLGTAGQTQSKSFATAERTQREAEKLVAEKLRKGYVETRSDRSVGTLNRADV